MRVFAYANMPILPVLFMSLAISGIALIPTEVSGLTYHDPILIDGDSGFTNASGVVRGSGTTMDPYVIEGWEINGVGATGAGIHVNNTNARFIIRDVMVSSTVSSTGILLENLANGTVEDVTISNCYRGIGFLNTDDGAIDGCRVYNSLDDGILLKDTINITVQHCVLDNNSCGIRDTSINNTYGFPKLFSSNDFVGNVYGLRTSTVTAVTMNNSFSLNNVGLWCLGGWTTITGNMFSDSTSFAIEVVAGAPSNNIWNNSFFGNNGAGVVYDPSHIQAYDDGTNTHWDDGAFGNYWSDWQSPDDDHDGIVDVPYHLAANPMHIVAGYDNYPLTTSPVIPEVPSIAALTIVFLAVLLLAVAINRRRG